MIRVHFGPDLSDDEYDEEKQYEEKDRDLLHGLVLRDPRPVSQGNDGGALRKRG